VRISSRGVSSAICLSTDTRLNSSPSKKSRRTRSPRRLVSPAQDASGDVSAADWSPPCVCLSTLL